MMRDVVAEMTRPPEVRPDGAAAKLCLNMIVRNEMANLDRCLGAVAGHIDCWVIGDTGSSDGTQDFIRAYFARRGIPGELHEFPFETWEQARNEALDRARASSLEFDYLLFDDADMELVVEAEDFRATLDAPGYQLLQRANSGLVYWNTRLARRDIAARYHGVTHEYLDVPGGTKRLRGVWYKDHASGSNREDKFDRDAKLLEAGLRDDPENRRYWFYLAQSYRDAGKLKEAAETYAKRAGMGGWDEEAWRARLEEARCLRELGDDGGFIRQALAAFNERPARAEPLYDLARFHRLRAMHDASVLFCEAGLRIARPDSDILFLEDYVYSAGMREEYSISANYAKDPARKARGHAACEYLSVCLDVPPATRELARSNLRYYMEPASAIMPSFAARKVGFQAPEGYRAMNPSVARDGDELLMVQRTVNYTVVDNGSYETPGGAPIHTRNYLLRLDSDLDVLNAVEIQPPANLPPPRGAEVRGFEDMRLFSWQGELWCSSTARELTQELWCQQVLARLDTRDGESCVMTDWWVMSPAGRHEKNWMPRVEEKSLRFVYSCDPTRMVDHRGALVNETVSPIEATWRRGGSQAIPFDGGWLAIVHEAREDQTKARSYQHSFVWFDAAGTLTRFSHRFYFRQIGIEFAAGMAWHPDGGRLVISFGVADRESWIATVEATDVRRLLTDVAGLDDDLHGRERNGVVEIGERDAMREHSIRPADSLSPDSGAAMAGTVTADVGERPAAPRPSKTADENSFLAFAPFLRDTDSPAERRSRSLAFDSRIVPLLAGGDLSSLPRIHCFYEVLNDHGRHDSLVAATSSMRARGHSVTVWTYTPDKLAGLLAPGIEIGAAADVVPRRLFDRIVAGSEIRYFSDLFRYAVLYEHGGLWMDSDVVLLRPFPFRGDYFFNLQWRGGHIGHYICGNVMFARPYDRHMRHLYETAVRWFFDSRGVKFGDIGPRLLSDHVMSADGAELRPFVFSPMFFNTIDWTEVDRFDLPMEDLADYLNDPRIFGLHLWNARTHAKSGADSDSLIARLTRTPVSFTDLADQFNTDKNRHTGNRHCYARVYDRLLSPRRFAMNTLMEIGLCRGLAEGTQSETPSVALWQSWFPFCHVIGVDLTDFSRLNNTRFTSFVCDQSRDTDLRAVAARIAPGSLDVIIDDGSHASHDQQLTFRHFFPLLAAGGWYFIEDLDWQPPGEDRTEIALTKELFREIAAHGHATSVDKHRVGDFAAQFQEILFFDSHYELARAAFLGGLMAIRKTGGDGFLP